MDGRVVLVSGNFNTIHPGPPPLASSFACGVWRCSWLSLLPMTWRSGVLVPAALKAPRGQVPQLRRLMRWCCKASPEQLIRQLLPDVVVKGKEHEALGQPRAGRSRVLWWQVDFSVPVEMRFSSIDLLKQEMAESTYLSSIDPPIGLPNSGTAFTMAAYLRATVLAQFKGLSRDGGRRS